MKDPDQRALRTGFVGGLVLGAAFCLVVCMACITAVSLALSPPRQVIYRLATAWAAAPMLRNTPAPEMSTTPTPAPTTGQEVPATFTPSRTRVLIPTATPTWTPQPLFTPPLRTRTPTPRAPSRQTPIPPGPPPGAELLAPGVWACAEPDGILGAAFVGSSRDRVYYSLYCDEIDVIPPRDRVCFQDEKSAQDAEYEQAPDCSR